ncbi:BrnT family toxin [Novosphingobium sp.]|uniref:BrnT family toxin n=1 Tax=Novosphingobium sp. TaxID=1874826 RepID=UPI002FD90B16
MEISFDPAKREAARQERGLDFADAPEVFAGLVFEGEDDRRDYGEKRFITVGLLRGRMVVLVWTPRGAARHIISMRKANDREQARYKTRLG